MSNHYDAIVVGAGPAGAGTALLLAERGRRVLLLEKEVFPRYKTCAGAVDGMGMRILAEMGIDVRQVCEDRLVELCVTSEGLHMATHHFERPMAIMTMRRDLDALIARVAVQRGAEFHDAEPVKTVQDDGRRVAAITAKARYEADILIGADGTYGLVARTFGLNRDPIRYMLMEAEIEVDAAVQEAWAGRGHIDICVWPLGYGWIFPKRSHLSVGIGVPWRYAKQLARRFEQFRLRSGLADGRIVRKHGHLLAFRKRQAALATDRVMLVGDAAGLVDPNTGGGIGTSLRSASIASEVALSFLSGETTTLRGYTFRIDKELEPELRAARILRNGILLRFLLMPARATHNAGLWQDVARIARGDETYRASNARSLLASCLGWTNAIPL